MRRTTGVIVGACAVLALAGSAGATAYAYTSIRPMPVGTWQPAPDTVAPAAPDAATAPATAPGAATAPGRQTPTRVARNGPLGPGKSGRQRVGTLLKAGKPVRYVGGPMRERFSYPGASYVKLHFGQMLLLPGDYVTVSDGSGTEVHRYEAPTPTDVKALLRGVLPTATDRWAMSVTGDTAILELHRASDGLLRLGAALGRLGVTVDKVARGYTDQETATAEPLVAPGQTGREESVCGADQSRDVVCYRSTDPVAYTRSKAIARLLINGTELCTGWRVGPNNRMLTNNHCFDNSDEAYETEVWFNYQCAQCGGYATVRPTKVWGDRVLATNRAYDYTLFTVEDFTQVAKFGFLALDPRRPNRNEALYIPQHPAGKPTRIAGARGQHAGNCQVVDRAYDGYARDSDVSYYCDTAGGSSGSPVLSRVTHKVVALHHFGGCPNSGVRADLITTRIRKLL